MELLHESTVQLIDYMGGDAQVVNSARVSFADDIDLAAQVAAFGDDERGLIRFLMENRHGTPFESTVMTFRIKTPIFVAREWVRHRIASYNEMSGRYTELPCEFFMPAQARSQTGKPGSYRFTVMELPDTLRMQGEMKYCYERCWEGYQRMLKCGIAKEQARMVLPVGIFTQFYWTVNARSLMNFLELRMAPNAMLEIRECAEEVHSAFHLVARVTCEHFDTYGKAP
jgi:thymidylate synthase (FAD)